jgi:hypothetical protein
VVNWAGFKAAVSYNFDDANSSQVSNYATLKALGIPFTFYLIGNKVATSESAWAQAAKDGSELGNHTQDHNTVDANNVDQGQQTIESDFGVKIHTMAAPNGDTGYDQFAQTRYLLNRGVADGLMMPGNETSPNPFNTFCYIPPTGAATTAFNAEIDGARSGGGWRVILVHGFTGGTDSAFQPVPLANYTAGVMYAKSFPDVWIDTMVQIGSYWRGQNAFTKATKTASGTSTTWTWTLPANFPTGKFLRVTVDGGTLTQNGTALVWDTHGYYEMSLDVGSVTLSP